MVVIDDLDEWLDFASSRLASFRHPARDLGWGAFKTGNECVWEWVRFGTGIEWLDNHDLVDLKSVSNLRQHTGKDALIVVGKMFLITLVAIVPSFLHIVPE
jgi:hypothetical protein